MNIISVYSISHVFVSTYLFFYISMCLPISVDLSVHRSSLRAFSLPWLQLYASFYTFSSSYFSMHLIIHSTIVLFISFPAFLCMPGSYISMIIHPYVRPSPSVYLLNSAAENAKSHVPSPGSKGWRERGLRSRHIDPRRTPSVSAAECEAQETVLLCMREKDTLITRQVPYKLILLLPLASVVKFCHVTLVL